MHRLVIHHDGRLVGQLDTAPGCPTALLDAIADGLRQVHGCAVERLVAHGERRILESGPDGLRVLASTPLFEPAPGG